MDEIPLAPEVTERLLIAKSILDQIKGQATPGPDRQSVVLGVLLAHDAAELALAAIADQLDKIPGGSQHYLMDYVSSLKSVHPETDVVGRNYCDQLNRVRNNVKHKGIFPDPLQWARVGEKVYDYVSAWCSQYLGLAFDDLDRSVLLANQSVREHYDKAKVHFANQEYKKTLEELAWALSVTFQKNPALGGIDVGVSKAEDAIRLAAFGVHANDFLRLQQFLPRIIGWQRPPELVWDQGTYGHPGNWHEDATRFCLNSFLDIAIKVQGATWIPSPMYFSVLYEHKIEVIEDDVEVWNLLEGTPYSYTLSGNIVNREVVRKLKRGEIFRGSASKEKPDTGLLAALQETKQKREEIHIIIGMDFATSGYVPKQAVRVTCIPKDNDTIKRYFPNLPEIDWKP